MAPAAPPPAPLSRRLNSEASVDGILDDVIDTAIELTSAERGFLLAPPARRRARPVVSRNFAITDLSARARRRRVGGTDVPFVDTADLIALKILAGRDKDLAAAAKRNTGYLSRLEQT